MTTPRIKILTTALLATTGLHLAALHGGQKAPELAGSAEAFVEAWNAGDSDALGALYTEDAILMPPNRKAAKGRDAIGEAMSAETSPGVTLELKDMESVVSGDLALKWGYHTVKGPDGSVLDTGHYVEIRKPVDGEWLIHRDIYNSDLPPVAAGMPATSAAIEGFVAVWNTKQLDGLDAVLTDDFTRTSPSGDADGLPAMKEAMQKLFTAYPDLTIELNQVQYYNDGAALHWQFTGTNTGPGDAPPTGKPVTLDGLTLIKMKDGKIASEDVRFDALNWYQQLGYSLQAPAQ